MLDSILPLSIPLLLVSFLSLICVSWRIQLGQPESCIYSKASLASLCSATVVKVFISITTAVIEFDCKYWLFELSICERVPVVCQRDILLQTDLSSDTTTTCWFSHILWYVRCTCTAREVSMLFRPFCGSLCSLNLVLICYTELNTNIENPQLWPEQLTRLKQHNARRA